MTNAEKEVAKYWKNMEFNGLMNNPCLSGMKINDHECGHRISSSFILGFT